jgi:hypothetical protein
MIKPGASKHEQATSATHISSLTYMNQPYRMVFFLKQNYQGFTVGARCRPQMQTSLPLVSLRRVMADKTYIVGLGLSNVK